MASKRGGQICAAHYMNFEDLLLSVPYSGGSAKMLRCPEDRCCSDPECLRGSACCVACMAPLCSDCKEDLGSRSPKMPAAELVNDMMIYYIFYAPRELFTQNVTVMEMICASTCITSMICFTLEKIPRSTFFR